MSNPIQGIGGHAAGLSRPGQTPLTDSQKASAQEIIAKYDSETITQESFDSLKTELREAGVGPSRELRTLVEDSGLDIGQFFPGKPDGAGGGRPAGVGGRPPGVGGGRPAGVGGPPSGGQSLDVEGLQSLFDILEQYDLDKLSSEDQENLQSDLTSSGLFQSGLVFNWTFAKR